ncbi:LysR substrate-binding domain-containing protein [Pseudorhodoferax sp. Leaf274]|uniref:LysR substrate-binding domain-containing protein n=1 Tax=Pseudorhodoferax sp. Leaf274 TaxID=1736318 RepID=UPI001F43B83A|nr:LysR substrate-binding domain-containing protein [Pseudorhodoferax sp. Leaf274]
MRVEREHAIVAQQQGPPLSRQMRQMEDELGVELFVRTARGIQLTEAAQSLLHDVPNILELARLARERALRAGKGMLGDLHVGIFGSGVLNVIPKLIGAFHAQRPEVRIRLRNLTKGEQIQALREHRITVGFHRLPPVEPDLAVLLVLREPMYVGMHESHALARQAEVSIRDLERQPMVLYPNTPLAGLAQEVMGAFRREKVQIAVEQEVEDVTTCVGLVCARLGLCITTESGTMLRLPGAVFRPLRSRFLKDIELSCVHRKADHSPVLAAFMEVVRGYAGDADRS